jgi:hypothetical protein
VACAFRKNLGFTGAREWRTKNTPNYTSQIERHGCRNFKAPWRTGDLRQKSQSCIFLPAPANPAVVTCGACNSLKASAFVSISLILSGLRVPVGKEQIKHFKAPY